MSKTAPCRECGEQTDASDRLCLDCWGGADANARDFGRRDDPPRRPAQVLPIVTPKKTNP